jgi:hypothetical protein
MNSIWHVSWLLHALIVPKLRHHPGMLAADHCSVCVKLMLVDFKLGTAQQIVQSSQPGMATLAESMPQAADSASSEA